MARPARVVTADVVLRSRSGRRLRDLGTEPLPDDLEPYLAPAERRREAARILEGLGFRVHPDALGMTLSIQGSPELFARVFGGSAQTLRAPAATEHVTLTPPARLAELVDEVVLTPVPEMFA
jgi:hypothetical protein